MEGIEVFTQEVAASGASREFSVIAFETAPFGEVVGDVEGAFTGGCVSGLNVRRGERHFLLTRGRGKRDKEGLLVIDEMYLALSSAFLLAGKNNDVSA